MATAHAGGISSAMCLSSSAGTSPDTSRGDRRADLVMKSCSFRRGPSSVLQRSQCKAQVLVIQVALCRLHDTLTWQCAQMHKAAAACLSSDYQSILFDHLCALQSRGITPR